MRGLLLFSSLVFVGVLATFISVDLAPANMLAVPKFTYDATCDIISSGEADLHVDAQLSMGSVGTCPVDETDSLSANEDLIATGGTMDEFVDGDTSCGDEELPLDNCTDYILSAHVDARTDWDVVATVDDITVTITSDVLIEVVGQRGPGEFAPFNFVDGYWKIIDCDKLEITVPFSRGNLATTNIEVTTDTLVRTQTGGVFVNELGIARWRVVKDGDGDCLVEETNPGDDNVYPTDDTDPDWPWVVLEQDGAGTTTGPTPTFKLTGKLTGPVDFILIVEYETDNSAAVAPGCNDNLSESPHLDDEVFTLVLEPKL